ncbi:MAG: class I SAM-dependent methyltransferase family protein [Thermoproteota archaeon]|nr:MAG: class I SAM-dependent methyltransferase family protein [Candidatus Korarchaeota archaeon]
MRVDIVGSRQKAVAIISLARGESRSEAESYAKQLIEQYRHVKSVLLRASPRTGEYRLREYEVIAGDPDTEVIHIEHGYKLALDPRRVYFSPREAYERQLVAEMVSSGEKVLVMFAGVGPMCIAIAKRRKVDVVVGVEISRVAWEYMVRNIRLNKLPNVRAVLGDVRFVCPFLKGVFDRVLMPLPLEGALYLDLAVDTLKERGVISLYGLSGYSGEELVNKVSEEMEELNVEWGVIGKRRVATYAPRVYKFRVDIEVKLK